jgi:glycosyltransferase involved in cell wall biosynthesis
MAASGADSPIEPPTTEIRQATVGAVILAHDEVDLIEGCVGSVAWADEQIVVDDGTTDRIRPLAEAAGARVIVSPWRGFPQQRNNGLRFATCDWLLFVDADERVPPSLAREIRQRIQFPGDVVGYWVPRRNIIAGEWVRHAGWWPDRQLRLLRRGHAHYDEGRAVHELAILDGPDDVLTEPFLHLNYATLAEFRAKQHRYAVLEAKALWESGIRPKPHSLVLQPIRELRRRLVELGGIRQGPMGLRLGCEMALATFWTYRELRSIVKQGGLSVEWQP